MDVTAIDEEGSYGLVKMNDDYEGPLLLFADFMNVLGNHEGIVRGMAEQGTSVGLKVTELAFDLPMELRVSENETREMILRAGPPTQRVDTTIFPVLHRLRVRLTYIAGVEEKDKLTIEGK